MVDHGEVATRSPQAPSERPNGDPHPRGPEARGPKPGARGRRRARDRRRRAGGLAGPALSASEKKTERERTSKTETEGPAGEAAP